MNNIGFKALVYVSYIILDVYIYVYIFAVLFLILMLIMHFCMCILLQNLTEFNTAHNRRIVSVADMVDVPNPLKRTSKSTHVAFADEDEIINPGMENNK